MKTLIAAVIASAFSIGALAAPSAPAAAGSAPMAKTSTMKGSGAGKKPATKAPKKSKKAASAPAA